MEALLQSYTPAVWALGTMAGMLLVQMLVLDVVGIKSGHVPGSPVAVDHGNFLFRATRAHANTNESIAVFILLVLFGFLSSASPAWLNSLAWVYVFARLGHMSFYYAGLSTARSVAFGIGLVALVVMLIVGVMAWL